MQNIVPMPKNIFAKNPSGRDLKFFDKKEGPSHQLLILASLVIYFKHRSDLGNSFSG